MYLYMYMDKAEVFYGTNRLSGTYSGSSARDSRLFGRIAALKWI